MVGGLYIDTRLFPKYVWMKMRNLKREENSGFSGFAWGRTETRTMEKAKTSAILPPVQTRPVEGHISVTEINLQIWNY